MARYPRLSKFACGTTDKLEIKDDRAKLEGLSNEELVTYLEDLKNLAVMLRNQGQANGQEEK
jgi:hypothetical protein